MAKLARIPQRAFEEWIKSDWYTWHPCDLKRFHAFVWAVVRYSRRPPSESDIRDLIYLHWDGRLHDLGRYALEASLKYQALYEFGKDRNAPGVSSRAMEQFLAQARADNSQ